jgi:general secretion pathway protein G
MKTSNFKIQTSERLQIPSAKSARGFTLIELMLVLVILSILAAIVVPKFSGRTQQARETAAQTQIAAFKTSLNMFETDTGTYPRGRAGLQDLLVQPRDLQGWHGPYLDTDKGVVNDPWGHPYVYECPGKHGAYDLYSIGPDGRAGTEDDITSWDTKK